MRQKIAAIILGIGVCMTGIVHSNIEMQNLHLVNPEIRCDHLMHFLEIAVDRGYIGEPVSQQEHALQCAYFAADITSDEEFILAALFHDIGHLCGGDDLEKMEELGIASHEIVGADYLRTYGMSEKICQLVMGHVQAKRYLTTTTPSYVDQLSDASKETLRLQGGEMTPSEVAEFENDPLFKEKILIRFCDEKAKVQGLQVPDLTYYRPMVLKHLKRIFEASDQTLKTSSLKEGKL